MWTRIIPSTIVIPPFFKVPTQFPHVQAFLLHASFSNVLQLLRYSRQQVSASLSNILYRERLDKKEGGNYFVWYCPGLRHFTLEVYSWCVDCETGETDSAHWSQAWIFNSSRASRECILGCVTLQPCSSLAAMSDCVTSRQLFLHTARSEKHCNRDCDRLVYSRLRVANLLSSMPRATIAIFISFPYSFQLHCPSLSHWSTPPFLSSFSFFFFGLPSYCFRGW